MKRVLQYIVYLAALVFMKFMEILPRGTFRFLGWLFSWLAVPLPPVGGLIRKNLRCAFPEKDEKEIFDLSRRCIANLIQTVCELFWFHNRPEKVKEMIDVQPNLAAVAENARKCIAEGRPVILITPHHGNWEFSGMALGLYFGFKMATVVRTPRNPYLSRLITGGRSVKNVSIIESRGGMMKLVHAMENGSVAGMLVDQNIKVRNGGVRSSRSRFALSGNDGSEEERIHRRRLLHPSSERTFQGDDGSASEASMRVHFRRRGDSGHHEDDRKSDPHGSGAIPLALQPFPVYSGECVAGTQGEVSFLRENGQAFVLFQTCKGFRQGLSYAEVAAHQKSGAGRGGRY